MVKRKENLNMFPRVGNIIRKQKDNNFMCLKVMGKVEWQLCIAIATVPAMKTCEEVEP
jgi:hypothetical protein